MFGVLLVCSRGTCFCEDKLEFFLVNEQKKRQEHVRDSLDSMWDQVFGCMWAVHMYEVVQT